MTEAVWLATEQPGQLLALVHGQASERKLRLFGVHCCRQNEDTITDPRVRRTLNVAEDHADGRVTESDRAAAESNVLDVFEAELEREDRVDPSGSFDTSADEVVRLIARDHYTVYCATSCAASAVYNALYASANAFEGVNIELEYEQCALLRDIFGNPFRPVAFAPAWRTDTAVAIARGMYEARDFGAMPILADALQDAGCDSPDILTHCRSDGPHVRGCWVVDLVLGKE